MNFFVSDFVSESLCITLDSINTDDVPPPVGIATMARMGGLLGAKVNPPLVPACGPVIYVRSKATIGYRVQYGGEHTEYGLDYTSVGAIGAGPLGHPYPDTISRGEMDRIHAAWLTAPGASTFNHFITILSANTLQKYLCFALQVAADYKPIRTIAFRLLGRSADGFDGAGGLFANLQEAALAEQAKLAPQLMAYRRKNKLKECLGPIGSAVHPETNVTQTGYLAITNLVWLQTSVTDVVLSDFCEDESSLVSACLTVWPENHQAMPTTEVSWLCKPAAVMMIILSHYLWGHFEGEITKLAEVALSMGNNVEPRIANVKLLARVLIKIVRDYGGDVERIKDLLRASVTGATASDVTALFQLLEQSTSFEIVEVKNTYSLSDEDAVEKTGGLMHILASVVFKPRKPGSAMPLTYGDVWDDKVGFAAAIEAAAAANSESFESERVVQNAFAVMSGVMRGQHRDVAIEMVTEIQFHLQYYLTQKKKTHFWYSILRAPSFTDLAADCKVHSDAE